MTDKEHQKMNDDDICPEAKELADKALDLSKKQLARAIQDLINTAAEQTAGNIFRSMEAMK
jgi:hypothetical protein